MKKILIVDDDLDVAEVIQIILEDADYITEIVTQGKEAYQRVKKYKPDLILLDILLSGGDGRTICRKLKDQTSTKNIPVIMVSAHPLVVNTIKKYDADDFLAKPFHMDKLLEMVRKHIMKKREG